MSKEIITFVILLLIVIYVLWYIRYRSKQVEGFWGLPNRTVKVDPEFKYQKAMFSVPPTYQSSLSPRFSNVNYGANILYNLPDQEYLGSPSEPLGYGKGQTPVSGVPKCSGSGGCSVEGYRSKGEPGEGIVPSSDVLDVQTAGSMEVEQPIVYDRFVYANQKSRLYGLGDPIRGDIPIAPIRDNWFRPSVYPNIDLRTGAMTIMGGSDNSTANELRALQAQYTADYVQGSEPGISQKDISLGAGQGDIQVTAFP